MQFSVEPGDLAGLGLGGLQICLKFVCGLRFATEAEHLSLQLADLGCLSTEALAFGGCRCEVGLQLGGSTVAGLKVCTNGLQFAFERRDLVRPGLERRYLGFEGGYTLGSGTKIDNLVLKGVGNVGPASERDNLGLQPLGVIGLGPQIDDLLFKTGNRVSTTLDLAQLAFELRDTLGAIAEFQYLGLQRVRTLFAGFQRAHP